MAEYATPTNVSNPMLDPVVFWRVGAFALGAIAVVGMVWSAVAGPGAGIGGVLRFDWSHNIAHLLLAGVAVLFGFANLPGNAVRVAALTVGGVYGILGAAGFLDASAFLPEAMHLHLEPAENVLHLLLGAWGLVTGIVARY